MEERKKQEIEWADFRRNLSEDKNPDEVKKYHANMKFYSVVRKTLSHVDKWLEKNIPNKKTLELACGNDGYAKMAAKYLGINGELIAGDIAPLSIEQAKESAKSDKNWSRVDYRVMDCESLDFPDNSFDNVMEGGALHHMELEVVYSEVARVLNSDGKFFCVEAIKHNPIIHAYRKMTPHLRTPWETPHILGAKEIKLGLRYFDKVEISNYHLFTILAVPFRKTFLFKPLLSVFESLDSIILKMPGVKWLAWQAVFEFSKPKK